MDSFQYAFASHMRSEIDTIAALSLHPNTPPPGSELEKSTEAIFDKREGNNLMAAGLTDVLPFFLFNFDSEFEDGESLQF